jgi:hypothetical protein
MNKYIAIVARLHELQRYVHQVVNASTEQFQYLGKRVPEYLANEFRKNEVARISRELSIIDQTLVGKFVISNNGRGNYVVGRVYIPELLTERDVVFDHEYEMLRYVAERNNDRLNMAARFYLKIKES